MTVNELIAALQALVAEKSELVYAEARAHSKKASESSWEENKFHSVNASLAFDKHKRLTGLLRTLKDLG